jgi:hypothetical protein
MGCDWASGGSDDVHPHFGADQPERLTRICIVGQRRETIEEPFHSGRGEDHEDAREIVADVLETSHAPEVRGVTLATTGFASRWAADLGSAYGIVRVERIASGGTRRTGGLSEGRRGRRSR